MDNISHTMHYYSSTTLLGPIFIFIFGIHLFYRKITVFILKSTVIQSKQLTKYLTFYLLNEIINSVTINKSSFFSIMCMQIKIKAQSMIFIKIICKLFNCINRRLILERRINIISI